MSLQESIRRILKETKEEKINKFITSNFDNVFDKLELKVVTVGDLRGGFYYIWYDEENESVFTKNNAGRLYVQDCETFKKIRGYSNVFNLDLSSFKKVLINYLNNKYENDFAKSEPVFEISRADVYGCLDEE